VIAGAALIGQDAVKAPRRSAADPPHRIGRVRRVRAHGGGPLPARLRSHPAARRRRVGAWQRSLAGDPAPHRASDPRAGTGNRSAVPASGDVAGLSGLRGQCNWLFRSDRTQVLGASSAVGPGRPWSLGLIKPSSKNSSNFHHLITKSEGCHPGIDPDRRPAISSRRVVWSGSANWVAMI
jgi:hypothetical protein